MKPEACGGDRPVFWEPIDIHFARFIERLGGAPAPGLFVAAALVSRSAREGDVCLNLRPWAGRSVPGEPAGGVRECPELMQWQRQLAASPVVGRPGEERPLILDNGFRLYLYRHWAAQDDVVRFLLEKASETRWKERFLDEEAGRQRLREGLDRLFPAVAAPRDAAGPDWQKVAALAAAVGGLTVICGAPGTGKTATAAKAILLLLQLSRGERLRIALTAPTGKAAARLQEVLSRAWARWPTEAEPAEALPRRAMTIHRLLGSRPHSPGFRHNRKNLLPVDVVVVDEASMVDLPLLAGLVRALPPRARLILLGDRNQLASVEAGAVLSDICGAHPANAFSRALSARLGLLTDAGPASFQPRPGMPSLGDCLIELTTNYRFGAASDIHRLSLAINQGDGEAALRVLKEGGDGSCWRPLPAPHALHARLGEMVIHTFKPYLEQVETEGEITQLFDLFDRFRILCALRQGPYGAEEVNGLAERILREAGCIRTDGPWYPGRPVMILRNDYGRGLFNGDVGLVLPDPAQRGRLSAFFRDPEGGVRAFSPARLPDHETVYALTVHKSQGSEFDEVCLLLPERDAPVLTRELLYTAVTRARRRITIWADEELFRSAVARRIERSSGLRDLLWQGLPAVRSAPPRGAIRLDNRERID